MVDDSGPETGLASRDEHVEAEPAEDLRSWGLHEGTVALRSKSVPERHRATQPPKSVLAMPTLPPPSWSPVEVVPPPLPLAVLPPTPISTSVSSCFSGTVASVASSEVSTTASQPDGRGGGDADGEDRVPAASLAGTIATTEAKRLVEVVGAEVPGTATSAMSARGTVSGALKSMTIGPSLAEGGAGACACRDARGDGGDVDEVLGTEWWSSGVTRHVNGTSSSLRVASRWHRNSCASYAQYSQGVRQHTNPSAAAEHRAADLHCIAREQAVRMRESAFDSARVEGTRRRLVSLYNGAQTGSA